MKKILFAIGVLALGQAAAQTSYVSNNASSKTATITVNAGEGGGNGGLNFNGADHGKKGFVIPAGWTVKMVFKNVGTMPHSAAVTKGKTPPTSITVKDAAFAKAYTSKLVEGLAGGSAAETVTFKVGKAGTYNLVCGVPGHGLGGQYLGFVVSDSAKIASFK
ncbi:sulfocyanin-like copper-binding protein [Deinococcus arenicola]|uniref:Sulfocyanin-like copper-binding protein n=1 Tax=Deinococcus arenicola TaxID=2994950 RepID=A0ABU4DS64_9DEIO|nr:sulfocyanin-like copper-binding protein [Deinococcus sp. ZS9-10]MDV6375281.1 sulfocyanin-like copper-binding protein [Deinococcus sp. ZS9-10]